MAKKLNLIPYVEELEALRKLYLKTEQDIINIIGYKRMRGYVDFAEEASLIRVQQTLQNMINKSWDYVPTLIKKQYYLGKKYNAKAGYRNAMMLTTTQLNVINNLITNLMSELTEAAVTCNTIIQNTWKEALILGRRQGDVFRKAMLEGIAQGEASGRGISQAQAIFLEKMKKQGITAFVDGAGRKWNLYSYAMMASRTTSRQATNLGTLFADENWDLYEISSHLTTCAVCAPYEGRVFSRSGKNSDYPPLSAAFGKIDPNGSDELDNTWLNIHPNCMHVFMKYDTTGRTEKEIQEKKDFSNFEKNPITIDPRSKAEIEAYKAKEKGRQQLMDSYKQFQSYRLVLGNKMPKTFQTFLKHKVDNDVKYQAWQKAYRVINKQIKLSTK